MSLTHQSDEPLLRSQRPQDVHARSTGGGTEPSAPGRRGGGGRRPVAGNASTGRESCADSAGQPHGSCVGAPSGCTAASNTAALGRTTSRCRRRDGSHRRSNAGSRVAGPVLPGLDSDLQCGHDGPTGSISSRLRKRGTGLPRRVPSPAPFSGAPFSPTQHRLGGHARRRAARATMMLAEASARSDRQIHAVLNRR